MNLSNVILLDVYGNLPAAGVAGRLFFASDTLRVYRDNGAAWVDATPVLALSSQIMSGIAAARPDAATAGRLYFATDTLKVYRDSGATWVDVTPSAALSTAILRGLEASKPDAGTAGRVYFASDTLRILRDNGVTWDDATPVSSGGATELAIQIGFLIGWNGGAATGEDIGGHRYLPGDCVPTVVRAGCVTPPAGGAQTITIYRVRAGVATAILNSPLSIGAGVHTVKSTDFIANLEFKDGDYLTVSSAAAGVAGANIFIEVLTRASGAHGFAASFDGGISPVPANKTAYIGTLENGGTIRAWTAWCSPAGATVTFKVLRVSSPGAGLPTFVDSINSNGLTINSGGRMRSTVLTDFTNADIPAGCSLAVAVIANDFAIQCGLEVEL